jgi:hypothetical protein
MFDSMIGCDGRTPAKMMVSWYCVWASVRARGWEKERREGPRYSYLYMTNAMARTSSLGGEGMGVTAVHAMKEGTTCE